MRNPIPAILVLAVGMAGCDARSISGPVSGADDELGEITVNDVTVPYVAVKMAADFVGLSVREVWTMMYESAVRYGSEPDAILVETDMARAARILDHAGFPVPTDPGDGTLIQADDSGHMCTLMSFNGDWDDEEAVEYWEEHHLYPWGACVHAIMEHEGCTEETLERTKSEDDEGRVFLHVWCEPEAS